MRVGARVRGWLEALCLVGAVIATLLIADHFEMMPIGRESNTPRPVVRSVPPREPAVPERNESTLPDIRPSQTIIDPTVEARRRQAIRDRQTLDHLMDTCRFWSAQPFDRYQQDMRVQACNRALRFASENGLPQPSIPSSSVPQPIQPAQPRNRSVIEGYDCSHYTEGSIAYRDCRARVGKDLQESCRSLTSQSLSAAPTSPGIKEKAKAYCAAAERYKIVR